MVEALLDLEQGKLLMMPPDTPLSSSVTLRVAISHPISNESDQDFVPTPRDANPIIGQDMSGNELQPCIAFPKSQLEAGISWAILYICSWPLSSFLIVM